MAKISPPSKNKKGLPPVSSSDNLSKDSKEEVAMNFIVDKSFRVDYKSLAAEYGVSMKDILLESFELYKKNKGIR